jgi:pSer/pThr/pTyr-binding forkhead associated (FHA) protein
MPARLKVIRGRDLDREHRIDENTPALLGRSVKCDIRIADGKASRQHCRIECGGGRWLLRDNDSRNGTFVNRERVTETTLNSGDTVRIGDTAYKFSIDGEPDEGALGGTEVLVEEETSSLRSAEEMPERQYAAPDDAKAESGSPAAEPGGTVCAQCGRELADDAVERGEATDIGGRIYCARCVVDHEEESGADEPDSAAAEDSDSVADLGSLLESLQRATEADQPAGEPEPDAGPEEPEPTQGKPGLLDRLRRKKKKH